MHCAMSVWQLMFLHETEVYHGTRTMCNREPSLLMCYQIDYIIPSDYRVSHKWTEAIMNSMADALREIWKL